MEHDGAAGGHVRYRADAEVSESLRRQGGLR
jgi:hypothetical protein